MANQSTSNSRLDSCSMPRFGAEYLPTTTTEETLGWLRRYRAAR